MKASQKLMHKLNEEAVLCCVALPPAVVTKRTNGSNVSPTVLGIIHIHPVLSYSLQPPS